MKLKIVSLTLNVFPTVESPLDVKLVWQPHAVPELTRYFLYQARLTKGRDERYHLVAEIGKGLHAWTVFVEAGRNFKWRIAAVNSERKWLAATNAIHLFDVIRQEVPLNFIKKLGGYFT